MADSPPHPRRTPRVPLIDALRGGAVIAMAVYHFSWDLSYHHLVDWDVVGDPLWRGFAIAIAASFLMLVGVSLVLAAQGGMDVRRSLIRLGKIAAGAAAVSLVTFLLFPSGWVRFGILHMIAAGSLIGLLFTRLPTPLTLAVAAGVLAAPSFLTSPAFDHPLLVWTGLGATVPPANDYVPVVPWLSAVLIGIAAGRLLTEGWVPVPRWRPSGGGGRALVTLGRWSLVVYLAHQPILFGITALIATALPADPVVERAKFVGACERECQAGVDDAAACRTFCGCVAGSLDGTPYWSVRGGDPELGSLVATAVSACQIPPDAAPLPP